MTAQAVQLQRQIGQAQNSDGGWGYYPGSSWTEPTALAVLALQAAGAIGDACSLGCAWLKRHQRQDGGWAPHPALDISTSVTSWAVLVLSELDKVDPYATRGTEWILRQVNSDPSLFERLLCHLFSVPPAKAAGGSAWFPGTAAWIAPSVTSILALSHAVPSASPETRRTLVTQIRRAQAFILSRKCRDGGWNHGGSPYRSEDAESYPEMTGMALLGLHGVSLPELERPLECARSYLAIPQSAEALSWLQLGLIRHGRPATINTPASCRSLRDLCLRLLALAGPGESNKLFPPTIDLT